jgi:hypothetical protein
MEKGAFAQAISEAVKRQLSAERLGRNSTSR